MNNIGLDLMVKELSKRIDALEKENKVLRYKIGEFEISHGHICYCHPDSEKKDACNICGRHINNPTTGECGCPNGYCTCRH
jgi:hypothetical protein